MGLGDSQVNGTKSLITAIPYYKISFANISGRLKHSEKYNKLVFTLRQRLFGTSAV